MKLVFQVSQMFQEKEFYIVNGPSSHPKAVLEKKVAEVFFCLCIIMKQFHFKISDIYSLDACVFIVTLSYTLDTRPDKIICLYEFT